MKNLSFVLCVPCGEQPRILYHLDCEVYHLNLPLFYLSCPVDNKTISFVSNLEYMYEQRPVHRVRPVFICFIMLSEIPTGAGPLKLASQIKHTVDPGFCATLITQNMHLASFKSKSKVGFLQVFFKKLNSNCRLASCKLTQTKDPLNNQI